MRAAAFTLAISLLPCCAVAQTGGEKINSVAAHLSTALLIDDESSIVALLSDRVGVMEFHVAPTGEAESYDLKEVGKEKFLDVYHRARTLLGQPKSAQCGQSSNDYTMCDFKFDPDDRTLSTMALTKDGKVSVLVISYGRVSVK